jgi:hypothetical protein
MSRVERAIDAVEARRRSITGEEPSEVDPDGVRLMLVGLDVDAEEALAAADSVAQQVLAQAIAENSEPGVVLKSVWFFGFAAGRLYGEIAAGEDS